MITILLILRPSRIPVRSQSARFKSEEPKPAEDVFAIDSTGPVSGPNCDQMQDDVSTSICLSAEENDKATGNRRSVDTYSCSSMCVFNSFSRNIVVFLYMPKKEEK